MNSVDYANTADALVARIQALIPTHPEILTMDSPWALFQVDGFYCDDLQPSMYQAAWALRKAQTLASPESGAQP